MTDDVKDRWMLLAVIAACAMALIGGLAFLGCADKKTTREIINLLPVVDKPPIECPKKQCRHGQECVPCEDGEGQ